MKIKVQHNQTLFDIALHHLGNISYAMDIALKNNISMTDDLVVGAEIELPEIETTGKEQKVVKFFAANPMKIPSTVKPKL